MQFDQKMLSEVFADFCNQVLLQKYHFGDEQHYEQIREPLENNGCNPFIETEADYKIKLGSFLENRLWTNGITVHSEMARIYKHPKFSHSRPDLTLHIKSKDWLKECDREQSLKCVIELKGANVLDPYAAFKPSTYHNISYDISKLGSLPSILIRCLVFLDEALRVGKPCNRISEDGGKQYIENFITEATRAGVIVLSNNPLLNVFP